VVVDAVDECEQPLQLTIAADEDRRKISLLLIGARSLRVHTPSSRGQAAPPNKSCDASEVRQKDRLLRHVTKSIPNLSLP
jgi:hypothetical protein